MVARGDEFILHSRSKIVKKHPYIYIGVVLCVVLGIMLPHAMGDNGQIHVRDQFTSKNKSKVQPVYFSKNIETKQGAMLYLRHYGYLNCSETAARRKRQLSNPPLWGLLSEGSDDDENDSDQDDTCDDSDYVEALRIFQTEWEIAITGDLSDETKHLMNAGRCGNSDENLEYDKKIKPSQTDSQSRKSWQSHQSSQNQASWQNHNGPVTGRRKKRDIAEKDIVESSQSRVWNIIKDFTKWLVSGGDSSLYSNRLYNSDLSEIDIEPEIVYVDNVEVSSYTNEISIHFHLVPEGESDIQTPPKSLLSKLLLPEKRKTSRRKEMFHEIKSDIIKTALKRRKRRDTSDISTQGKRKSNPFSYAELSQRSKRVKRDQTYPTDGLNVSESSFNHKWNHPSSTERMVLTYTVIGDASSKNIPILDQCSTIALAFRMWSEVTNLDFAPAPKKQPIKDVNIHIGFGRKKHLNCDSDFDGRGHEIAHSSVFVIHLDDDECFTYYQDESDSPGEIVCISLLVTLLHEIGHIIGMDHKMNYTSIMYPTPSNRPDFELPTSDRKAIQKIYGRCSGRFAAVFDWVHTKPESAGGLTCMQPCECEIQDWQYYTYFFRTNIYWLYLNNKERPRYGDPKPTKGNWRYLKLPVDAVAQTMQRSEGACWGRKARIQYRMVTTFFSGDKYYIWNDLEDEVASSGFIADKFGPLPNQTTAIPNNVDAVMYDPRDSMLHFFKDGWVGVVDHTVADLMNGSCCTREYNFTDKFRFNATEYGELNNRTDVPEMNGYIDSLYMRYTDGVIYFFKNEYYWMADISSKKSKGRRWLNPGKPIDLQFMGEWNTRWNDLCDAYTSNHQEFCSRSDIWN